MRLSALASIYVTLIGCGDGGADPPADASVDASVFDCRPGASCAASGATCSSPGARCTCASGAGLAWACEPDDCPAVDGRDGDPCEIEGLVCDTGFENPGRRCIAPELRWSSCVYYHQATSPPGPPNACPISEPPAVGTPCCQALPLGGPPPGCRYGDVVYDCVGFHWAIVTGT